MGGIVGLSIKNPHLESQLGELLSPMLVEMGARGPDSAGIAVYRDPVGSNETKLTLVSDRIDYHWGRFVASLQEDFGAEVRFQPRVNHLVVVIPDSAAAARSWLRREHPELRLSSAGNTIEIFKEKGSPVDFVRRFELTELSGSHALCHTRMATESAVTTGHAQPFPTGLDLCLVHNGSLSNHNRLRQALRCKGVDFQTDNDSEVAAGYLTWRLRQGDSLEQALRAALRDLDGFYTLVIGTRDGFAVVRDRFGCKPAVMAETDDWVAIASEFRAIATLPGAEHAAIWEPEPETIYSWSRR